MVIYDLHRSTSFQSCKSITRVIYTSLFQEWSETSRVEGYVTIGTDLNRPIVSASNKIV
jgi:hypothetical protein